MSTLGRFTFRGPWGPVTGDVDLSPLLARTRGCVVNKVGVRISEDGKEWPKNTIALDAICALSAAQWLQTPNFGKVSLADLRAFLKANGRALAGEEPPPRLDRCRWCGLLEHAGVCPRVAAIEYHPGGKVKRVEFVQPLGAGPAHSERTGGI